MAFIDLRSDTVTKPTPDMRKAMAKAEVGDDVFGEDPTINALQEKVAGILGKEKAIFVPSGTMANQLAIKAHTQPGDEVILEATSHPYNFEGGAGAVLSGVQFYCLNGIRGILEASQIEEAIRPLDHHFPVTRLVCLENTHNRGGGSIYPLSTSPRSPDWPNQRSSRPSRRSQALECLRRLGNQTEGIRTVGGFRVGLSVEGAGAPRSVPW